MHPKQQHIIDIYGKEPTTLDEIAESCIAVISHNQGVRVVGFAWEIYYNRTIRNSHSSPIIGKTNFGANRVDGPTSYPGFCGRVWIRYASEPNFGTCSDCFAASLTHTGSGGGGSYDGIWTLISSSVYRTSQRDPVTGGRIVYKYPEPKCFSWDYRIFLDDFPILNASIGDEIRKHELQEDKNEVWAKVNAKYYRRKDYVHEHSFEWEDPATKANDDAYLKEIKHLVDEVPAYA